MLAKTQTRSLSKLQMLSNINSFFLFSGSALGADAYWISGLHLYTPLPFRPGKGGFGELFRTHFFINAGNLANIDISTLCTILSWEKFLCFFF